MKREQPAGAPKDKAPRARRERLSSLQRREQQEKAAKEEEKKAKHAEGLQVCCMNYDRRTISQAHEGDNCWKRLYIAVGANGTVATEVLILILQKSNMQLSISAATLSCMRQCGTWLCVQGAWRVFLLCPMIG